MSVWNLRYEFDCGVRTSEPEKLTCFQLQVPEFSQVRVVMIYQKYQRRERETIWSGKHNMLFILDEIKS